MTKLDSRIADNVFYVVEENKKFTIVVNGIELYEFIGYAGWNIKALSKITKREDANALADFLNKLFAFGREQKQKEIQKALGIVVQTVEEIDEAIDYRIKNTDIVDDIIDKKIGNHTRDYEHNSQYRS